MTVGKMTVGKMLEYEVTVHKMIQHEMTLSKWFQTKWLTKISQGALTEGSLVLTSLDQLIIILKILFPFATKQATLIRRSIVPSLPVEIVFPDMVHDMRLNQVHFFAAVNQFVRIKANLTQPAVFGQVCRLFVDRCGGLKKFFFGPRQKEWRMWQK